jgi:hypothetical protein
MKGFRPVHVVTMFVAGCLAAVLMPVTVQAATGSNVNIVDKLNSGSIARVTSKGTIWVNETDPYSGALGKVDSTGHRLVAGSTSMANPTTTLDTINDLTLSAADTRRQMFAGVGGKQVSLTSLITSAEGGTAGSVKLLFIAYVKSASTSGDCEGLSGFGAAERFTVMVPVGQTVNLNWPSPLVWTQYAGSGDYYCIDVESYGGPSGYTVHISAFGFRS